MTSQFHRKCFAVLVWQIIWSQICDCLFWESFPPLCIVWVFLTILPGFTMICGTSLKNCFWGFFSKVLETYKVSRILLKRSLMYIPANNVISNYNWSNKCCWNGIRLGIQKAPWWAKCKTFNTVILKPEHKWQYNCSSSTQTMASHHQRKVWIFYICFVQKVFFSNL